MPPGEGPASISEFAGPPEARRGQELFFDSTRTPRCAGCHALGGRGAAIGPDLLTGSARETRDFIGTVRAKSPKHVLVAKLTDGDTFPALRAGQKIRIHPVVRSYDRAPGVAEHSSGRKFARSRKGAIGVAERVSPAFTVMTTWPRSSPLFNGCGRGGKSQRLALECGSLLRLRSGEACFALRPATSSPGNRSVRLSESSVATCEY